MDFAGIRNYIDAGRLELHSYDPTMEKHSFKYYELSYYIQ